MKYLKRSGLRILQLSFNIRWALFLEHGNALVISVKIIPLHVVLYISIASSSFFLFGNISPAAAARS